jgi:lysophospholipase L1-like esterase
MAWNLQGRLKPGGTASSEDPRFLEGPWISQFRQFRKAWSLRTGAALDIAVIGDSISEGYPQSADANTYVGILRGYLQKGTLVPTQKGGEGFVPARHTVTTPAMETRWVHSVGVDQTNVINPGYGLAMRTVVLHPGDTSTITFTGTRLDVSYTQAPGAGTIQVAVDGGAPTSVLADNATLKTGRLLASATVGDGVHSAVVSVTGANVTFEGAMVYRADETTGIRIWNGAHASYTAVHFANPINLWDGIFEVVAFDLVIIALGVNDFSSAQTPAQLQANLEAIVDRIRAKSTVSPSFLFMVQWGNSTTGTPAQWQPFADATRAAARTRGAAIFDAWQVLGDPNSDGQVFYDAVHTAIYGNISLADALARMLIGGEQIYGLNHSRWHRDAGQDPLWYHRVKSGDQIVNNNAALQDDTELFADLPANSQFDVELMIFYDTTAAQDFKFGFTLPAGAAGRYGALAPTTTAVTQFATDAAAQPFTGTWGAAAVGGVAAGTILPLFIKGVLRTTNAGRFGFRFAQNAAAAVNTIVKQDSELKVTLR